MNNRKLLRRRETLPRISLEREEEKRDMLEIKEMRATFFIPSDF
jgi:hypothetical protein